MSPHVSRPWANSGAAVIGRPAFWPIVAVLPSPSTSICHTSRAPPPSPDAGRQHERELAGTMSATGLWL